MLNSCHPCPALSSPGPESGVLPTACWPYTVTGLDSCTFCMSSMPSTTRQATQVLFCCTCCRILIAGPALSPMLALMGQQWHSASRELDSQPSHRLRMLQGANSQLWKYQLAGCALRWGWAAGLPHAVCCAWLLRNCGACALLKEHAWQLQHDDTCSYRPQTHDAGISCFLNAATVRV